MKTETELTPEEKERKLNMAARRLRIACEKRPVDIGDVFAIACDIQWEKIYDWDRKSVWTLREWIIGLQETDTLFHRAEPRIAESYTNYGALADPAELVCVTTHKPHEQITADVIAIDEMGFALTPDLTVVYRGVDDS